MLNKDQMVALIMKDVASHFTKLQPGLNSVDIMGIFPSFHYLNVVSCTCKHHLLLCFPYSWCLCALVQLQLNNFERPHLLQKVPIKHFLGSEIDIPAL